MTDWKKDLGSFFERKEASRDHDEGTEFNRFIADVVVPALEDVASEMRSHGRTATIRSTQTTATVIIHYRGEEELSYRIQGRTFPDGAVRPYAEVRFRERKGLKLLTAESMFRTGDHTYALSEITAEEVIRNFVENYTQRVEP